MSLWSWLTSRSSEKNEKKSRGDDRDLSALLTTGAQIGPFTSAWTDRRVEQSRHFKHWVYIAISRICDKIASQAPNVGSLTTVGPDSSKTNKSYHRRLYLNSVVRHKALTPLSSHQDLEPVSPEHPLARLLSDPNDPDTSFDLWWETLLFLLLEGNAYWYVPKNRLGLPTAIWVIPSHWVWPILGTDKLVEAYDLRPTDGNYLRKTLPAEDVIHFRRKGPISKIDGYSALTAGSQWLDVQESIDTSRWHTFKNGAFPTVALEFDKDFVDPSAEELDRIQSKFLARYAGETKAGMPILLPPGVKLHNLRVTPREFDYSASAEQIRNQVLALFGVPHVIAGVSQGHTKGSLEEAKNTFYETTINPLCRYLGQVITEKLASIYSTNLRVWWDDMSTEDANLVERRMTEGVKFGLVAANEWRAFHGLPPFPHGGDNPIIIPIGVGLPWGTGEPDSMFTALGSNPNLPSEDSEEVPEETPKEESSSEE